MEPHLPDTEQPPRPPAATRPSLMGAPDTPTRTHTTTDAGRMRMLDELEAVVRPRPTARSSAPSNWLIALLAFGVVLGGLLWWSKHRPAESAPPVAPASARVASIAPKDAAATATTATAAAAASAPAVIETVAATVPAVAAAEIAPSDGPEVVAIGAPAATPPAPMAARAAPRLVAVPAARTNTPKADDAKVTTVTTASGGKWTVTVADASAPAANVADKPLPSPASAVAAPNRTRATPSGDDADVRLLSALLAHVSRPAPGAALAEEDQLTIAQIVKRCDARPAPEVRECRRRICEGYWGKAEACPGPVAKKG